MYNVAILGEKFIHQGLPLAGPVDSAMRSKLLHARSPAIARAAVWRLIELVGIITDMRDEQMSCCTGA